MDKEIEKMAGSDGFNFGFGLSRAGTFFGTAAMAIVLILVSCGAAIAAPQIKTFRAEMSDLQAGGHPDSLVSFRLKREDTGLVDFFGPRLAVVGGPPKDVLTVLPAGVTGNPGGFETCTGPELSQNACPVSSQVGVTRVGIGQVASEFEGDEDKELSFATGVYNMKPIPGEVAKLGFRPLGSASAFISIKLRSSDLRLVATAENLDDIKETWGADVVIWGSPADASHDPERPCYASPAEYGCSAQIRPKPFFTLGSDCSSASSTELAVDTWISPGDMATATSEPVRPVGCDRLSFDPSMNVSAGSIQREAPSGLNIGFEFPQYFDDPDGTETPPLRKAVVTLPEGMTINPASADGLQACTDAQLGAGTDQPVGCPDASKIGTVEATTPVLDEGVAGDVYLLSQNSSDPASGQMYRIALVLENEKRGVSVRLPGQVRVDPATGRLQTVFENNPQLPISTVDVHLKGGPRAPLVTPSACGQKKVTAQLTAWSGQVAELSSTFSVDGCGTGPQFEPGLEAGTVNPAAGAYSPFVLRVTRRDGEQNVSRIETTLPEGLLAKLAGVPLCDEAAAASGACSDASRIGRAVVGAGAGSNPLYVPEAGKAPTAVYLAGPYKGAPYSLVVKVPAQAGPFDLGVVAVRSGIQIDPVTAAVSVASDPLPQILGGIPIAYRDVRVEVDRSNFIVNPTSCEEMKVQGSVVSSEGIIAHPAVPFQAVGCRELGFKPKLSLRFSGAPPRRGGYPKLRATLTMPKGHANIGKAVVTLPETEFLENAHIRTICTRVQYAADQCPKGSVYGYAKAWTPLLDKPLQGPVYLRSSNHTLPDLVASLDGQIHIDLAGRIDSPGGKIRNTFWAVPDAPVSRFVLTMQGGRKGLLANNTNLCKAKPRAKAEFTGQNGKGSVSRPLVKVTGCGKGRQ